MGTMPETWKALPDLRAYFKLPIGLLVAALIIIGFYPQTFLRILTPTFRNYFSETVAKR